MALEPISLEARTGGTFKIVELSRNNVGSYVETPVQFEWTAKNQSAPRGSWPYGIKQRTVRTDYAGTDLPSEQILGSNYKPFTLSGRWVDRYNAVGFADATRVAMEELTQRGSLCRFSFQGVYIHGIITDLDIDYKNVFDVGYSFTVSPHYRNVGGDVRKQSVTIPQTIYSPQDNANQLAQQVNSLQTIQLSAPRPYIAGGLYDTVTAAIDNITNAMFKVNQILSGRVLTILESDSPVSSLKRLSQAFTDSFTAAALIPGTLEAQSTDIGLGYNSAIAILEFESWARETAATARLIMLICAIAAENLRLATETKALALYRPHANESFYSISNRFYGTPFKWRDIAERNNLETFVLTGTELLIIPDNRIGGQ